MPAEWKQHAATWLAWPRNPRFEKTYERMAEALAGGETVKILVTGARSRDRIAKRLKKCGVPDARLQFFPVSAQDVWIRDYGPIFVKKGGKKAFVAWRFNAWGGKYPDLVKDDKVPVKLTRYLKMPYFRPRAVLEGGSIDTDGFGTCLTTEQCLLNPNRNPHLGHPKIEELLSRYLGFSKVIWLGRGIAGDDTDGHVDDVARFTSPGTVVAVREARASDENHAALEENFRRLCAARDARGRKLEVVPLPMPRALRKGGRRLPASHANFYIGNAAVLVPVFGQASDRKALGILKGLFKGRAVTGIDCRELVAGCGAIHCVTQQEPA